MVLLSIASISSNTLADARMLLISQWALGYRLYMYSHLRWEVGGGGTTSWSLYRYMTRANLPQWCEVLLRRNWSLGMDTLMLGMHYATFEVIPQSCLVFEEERWCIFHYL